VNTHPNILKSLAANCTELTVHVQGREKSFQELFRLMKVKDVLLYSICQIPSFAQLGCTESSNYASSFLLS
jgi:hypothetical protein